MNQLVILDDEGKTTAFPLTSGEITIGRGADNTLRLDERNISRRHAKIRAHNDHYILEDLKSYNGIRVNGERVEGQAVVREGDRVSIGDFVLTVLPESADTASETTLPVPYAREELSAQTALIRTPENRTELARLVALSPAFQGLEIPLSQTRVRIGRGDDADIILDHPSISRVHADLLNFSGTLEVVDLQSANGVRVNGMETDHGMVESGDWLELGQIRFRYIAAGEPYRANLDPLMGLQGSYGSEKRKLIGWLTLAATLAVLGGGYGWFVWKKNQSPSLAVDSLEPPRAAPAFVPPNAEVALAEAIKKCEQALAQKQFAQASAHAAVALRIRAESAEALTCNRQAELALSEEQAFQAGKNAYERGDIEEAFGRFETLSKTSTYADNPLVIDTFHQIATQSLADGKALIATDPDAALAVLARVLRLPTLPQAMKEQALELQELAQQRMEARQALATQQTERVASARPIADRPIKRRTEPAEARVANETKSAAPAGKALQEATECLSHGDQRCAISALEGKARTAREYALLIETYRSVGDSLRAAAYMNTFVRKFPNERQVPAYKQYLAGHPAP